MKNDDVKKEKAKETMSNLWKKTVDISKKAADGAQKKAKEFAEQAKENHRDQQLKKYQPLTKEEFFSEEFRIPNFIQIVDDAVRRDIPVCEGAIGWREVHNSVEFLHLYDEFVDECGIEFIPRWECDNVYCVDRFKKNRYLNTKQVFRKATEEQIAELEHIAYSLGAKFCSVEIVDACVEASSNKMSIKVKTQYGNASSSTGSSSKAINGQSGKKISEFQGHDQPKAPELKWFEHDDNVKRLIEMRCSDPQSIKSTTLELRGTSTTVMSKTAACAIDKILKVGGSLSMERQATKEQSQILIFEITF